MDSKQLEQQMRVVVADQFSHQGPVDVLQIDREFLIEMLVKQTSHGYEVGYKEGAKTSKVKIVQQGPDDYDLEEIRHPH